MDALVAVDQLGNPQVGHQAAQGVGVLCAQVGALPDERDHLAQRLLDLQGPTGIGAFRR